MIDTVSAPVEEVHMCFRVSAFSGFEASGVLPYFDWSKFEGVLCKFTSLNKVLLEVVIEKEEEEGSSVQMDKAEAEHTFIRHNLPHLRAKSILRFEYAELTLPERCR